MSIPGKIGILGAGQLARMMALDGMPLGFEFAIYDTSGSPSAGIAQVFSDPDNTQTVLKDFLDQADVVTYEFEHLPLDLARRIEQERPLHPNVRSLETCQDREKEKTLFGKLGIPAAEWRMAKNAGELAKACETLGFPVVAKSAGEGYDGKGQAVIRDASQVEKAWAQIGYPRVIVESFVPFTRELSLIAVRGVDGAVVTYPLVENHHHEGILRYTFAPAQAVCATVQAKADHYIAQILEELDYVGVLALELFDTPEGLLANEMAPRVHNSGHWSQDGAHTSQFENHLRAVSGLPLGSTTAEHPVCMVNLIGCEVDKAQLLALPGCHLHWYGKSIRPGRKVGHINVIAKSHAELADRVQSVLTCVSEHAPFPDTLAR